MKRSTVLLLSGLLAAAASMAWFLSVLLYAIIFAKQDVMPSMAKEWMQNIQVILNFVRWCLFCMAFLFLGFDKRNSVAALMGGISSIFIVALNMICKFLGRGEWLLSRGKWLLLVLNWWSFVVVAVFLLAVVMLKNSVPKPVRIATIVSSGFMIISGFAHFCANVYQCLNGSTKGVCRFHDIYNIVDIWLSVVYAVMLVVYFIFQVMESKRACARSGRAAGVAYAYDDDLQCDGEILERGCKKEKGVGGLKICVAITFAIVTGAVLADGELEKGKVYPMVGTNDPFVVARKTADGVLCWTREDSAAKISWKKAGLLLVKVGDTSNVRRGMSLKEDVLPHFGVQSIKYVGTTRYGNMFVGHRNIITFVLPSKSEDAQAKQELVMEARRKATERRQNQDAAGHSQVSSKALQKSGREHDPVKRFLRVQEEMDRRTQRTDPRNVTLKVSTKGQTYYVNAVDPGHEYITVDDYIAAYDAVEKQEEAAAQKRHDELVANQPALKKYAASLFSQLNFNLLENVYIDKRLLPKASDIKVEVVHFAWNRLQQECRQRNWLVVLNILYDILNNSSDFTSHYDMFPEEEEIEGVYKRFQGFELNLKWTLPDHVGIVACGARPEDIMASLKYWKSEMEYQFSCQRSYKFLPFLGRKTYLGFTNGKPYGAHVKDIGAAILELSGNTEELAAGVYSIDHVSVIDDGKFIIPGMGAIEKDRLNLQSDLAARRIIQGDYDKRLSEIYTRFDAALQQTFVKFPDKTTIAQHNKRQQEEALRIEAERKRRYPAEQKARERYAAEKLGQISFDWKTYVRIQKDLMRYVHSIGVTEKKWAEMKSFQRQKDWLGLLGKISGTSMKDYPDERRIEELVNQVYSTKFNMEIEFTHAINVYVRRPPFDAREFDEQMHHNGNCLFSFIMKSACGERGPNIIVYAVSSKSTKGKGVVHIDYDHHRQKSKALQDKDLGRIDQHEYDSVLRRVNDEYQRELTEWLETTPVRIDGDSPIAGREKAMSPVDSPKTKPQWISCPDCGGSRYISKGQCDKCGGAGKFRTPVKSGIGGRPIGGRMTQCDKCKGKGEIKDLCKRCRGTGKIRQ